MSVFESGLVLGVHVLGPDLSFALTHKVLS